MATKSRASKVPLTRCSGRWTEARYNSFIKSAIRSMSSRWPVKYDVLKASYTQTKINPATGRMAKHHRCAICQEEFVAKQIQVDHVNPLIDIEGFTTWDRVIENALCEIDGLQAACRTCHAAKTREENDERRASKKRDS